MKFICNYSALHVIGAAAQPLALQLQSIVVARDRKAQAMKAAFAHWNKRIAPVFDTARAVHVVEARDGAIISETQALLPEELPLHKALRLAELGVDTLVCGAISRAADELVAAYAIRVIPFVAGDLGEVIRAWLNGTLARDAFTMPGCCARSRRPRRTTCPGTGEQPDTNGPGRRQSPAGQGRGRMGGPRAAGPMGACVCPKCGHSEPHERGVPCVQKQCPACGTLLTRQ
jgi:predicted Fe-Mo cluster-binding NifX family protein